VNFIKTIKYIYALISVLFIGFGIYIFIEPSISSYLICEIGGVMITVFGIIKILGYFSKDRYSLAFQFDLMLGMLSFILGVLMILHPDHIVNTLLIILGIFILIDGTSKIQTSLDAKIFGLDRWWIILILGILCTILAFILILNPLKSSILLIRLLALTFIMDGIENLSIVLDTVRKHYR
jgi:uncharacterized membrane protein HdeD (DUF308 family)